MLTPDECNVLLAFCRAGLAAMSSQASLEVLNKGSAAMLRLAQLVEAAANDGRNGDDEDERREA